MANGFTGRFMNRGRMKTLGKVVAYQRFPEVTEQLWQTPDGRHWIGDDWYSDRIAVVNEVTEECAAGFIAEVRQAYIDYMCAQPAAQ